MISLNFSNANKELVIIMPIKRICLYGCLMILFKSKYKMNGKNGSCHSSLYPIKTMYCNSTMFFRIKVKMIFNLKFYVIQKNDSGGDNRIFLKTLTHIINSITNNRRRHVIMVEKLNVSSSIVLSINYVLFLLNSTAR